MEAAYLGDGLHVLHRESCATGSMHLFDNGEALLRLRLVPRNRQLVTSTFNAHPSDRRFSRPPSEIPHSHKTTRALIRCDREVAGENRKGDGNRRRQKIKFHTIGSTRISDFLPRDFDARNGKKSSSACLRSSQSCFAPVHMKASTGRVLPFTVDRCLSISEERTTANNQQASSLLPCSPSSLDFVSLQRSRRSWGCIYVHPDAYRRTGDRHSEQNNYRI